MDTNKQNYRPADFVESPINYSAVFFIPPISVKQVVEDLKNIPDNKATGLDRIGIKPLKKALNAAAPSLTHIYNDSIASSSFPDNLKRAKLTHVHKNNSIHDRNNYGPISILSVISIPLERHVSRSYLKGLTSNTLLHSKQAENRPYHSCETALRSLTNNWLKAMDSKQAVGAVLLDFSKAFDLVDRSLLLSKLHTDNTSLRWSESYLHHRTQRCCINGSWSDALPIISRCISMPLHLQYLIAMWIFTPMTLHYGWLILILCISNTDFREVSTKRIFSSR